jgi:hypothetical protein
VIDRNELGPLRQGLKGHVGEGRVFHDLEHLGSPLRQSPSGPQVRCGADEDLAGLLHPIGLLQPLGVEVGHEVPATLTGRISPFSPFE